MSHNQKYVIDVEEGTSRMDLYNGSAFVTSYEFENGLVTLLERSDTEVMDVSTLRENVVKASGWIKLLNQFMNVGSLKRVPFEEEKKKTLTQITAKFEAGGETLANIVYNSTTNKFTFQPRLEAVVDFSTFTSYIGFLSRLLEDGEEF